jgi:hypothetical protein
MDSKSPNVEALRQLYKQSPVAKAFFDRSAARERDQSETKVDRTMVLLNRGGEHEFQRREILDFFRRLQDQGCGQFVEGRRGWPSRFVWSVGLRSVAKAAAGELHAVENISSEEDSPDQLLTDEDAGQPRIDRPAASSDRGENSNADWYEGDEANGEPPEPDQRAAVDL